MFVLLMHIVLNNEKTEEYNIQREGKDNWKKCKYLGTLLDTELGINRRKCLAIDTYNNFRNIFQSKNNSTETKMKIFNAFINSIFLYN